MRPVAFKDTTTQGDLAFRAAKNFERLHDERWHPGPVFMPHDYEWPADMEGRTILALVCLARALDKRPEHLDAILAKLPGVLNERGYLGPVMPEGIADEQVFSGHSWLLRGLLEHYAWNGRTESLEIARGIVEGLFLPAVDAYHGYPLESIVTEDVGEAAGERSGKQENGWVLSTDVGCAFIPIDGISHAYQVMKTPALKVLLDAAIARYAKADKAALRMQTHATLSGLRGVLRYYETDGDPAMLRLARDTYALYRGEAMTEHYANYNWFGRPEWTEPCAVVDSFIVAFQLWQHTGEAAYLEDAHHIYFNGLGYGQRPNGGFGCDVCAGARGPYLHPVSEALFEAYWCCTMRGAEGLAKAAEYAWMTDENGLTIPFYHESEARLAFADGTLSLKQTTGYPFDGCVYLEVLASDLTEPKTMRLHVPSWAESAVLKHNGQDVPAEVRQGFVSLTRVLAAGDRIELTFPVGLRKADRVNHLSVPEVFSLRHGPLVLGLANTDGTVVRLDPGGLTCEGNACYRVNGMDRTLGPVNDLIHLPVEEALKDRRQILFPA